MLDKLEKEFLEELLSAQENNNKLNTEQGGEIVG